MAAKRRAGKQLTQDNWDQEEEPEEVGVFEKAPENVLKNRIIRTAKRRGIGGSNEDGSSKSIFSGFSGFTSSMSNNSSKSFSFLSTAKSSDTNQAGDNKPSSLSFIPNSNNSDTVKSTGDAPNKPFSFLSKSKLPNGTDSEENKFPASFLSKTTNSTSDTNKLSFFTPDKPKNELKDAVSQPKLQELSKQLKKTDDSPSIKNTSSAAVNNDKNSEDIFLRKLKSLNLLCAEWILEHLNENPHCILTPVFDDYKKHLNQLQEERQANNTSSKRAKFEMKVEAEITAPPSTSFKAPNFKESLSKVNFGTSFFTKPLPQSQPELLFGNNETKPAYDFNKNAKSESDNVFKPTSTGMFSFGSNATSPDSKTDKPVESTIPKPTPAFSFTAKDSGSQFKNPFFNANSIPTASENVKPADNNEENEDQPPVQEDVSITEEGSVFDKKCKVFIKKDGNYVDFGVGFLFLKLVGEDEKCQLIVRANNKLANIIINVLISSSIPIQKQGKNNVMIVCCPTPDATPSAVLIKVKTGEDADQLLELMNKLKK